jgi:DNA-binding response OmpR family regulator
MIRAVSNVPVIIATARTAEHDLVNLLNAGADEYVTKPFSPRELASRVDTLLAAAAATAAVGEGRR